MQFPFFVVKRPQGNLKKASALSSEFELAGDPPQVLDELPELVVDSAFADGMPAITHSMGGPPGAIAAAAPIEGTTNVTAAISAIRVASGLDQPVFATAPPGDISRLFILELTGTIKILDLATGAVSVFLDISDQISTAGEGGLLGLAFDPNYAENGYFYVDLTNTSGDTEVRRYQASAGEPNLADPTSMTPIISVDQPDGRTNTRRGGSASARTASST